MRCRDTVVLSQPPPMQEEQLVPSSAAASRPDASPARGQVSAFLKLSQHTSVRSTDVTKLRKVLVDVVIL